MPTLEFGCLGFVVWGLDLSDEINRVRVWGFGLHRFQGGLVFKAHRLLCLSTLGLKVKKKKTFRVAGVGYLARHGVVTSTLVRVKVRVPVSESDRESEKERVWCKLPGLTWSCWSLQRTAPSGTIPPG